MGGSSITSARPRTCRRPGQASEASASPWLGIRTPCLLVSPLVARGQVWRPGDGRFADHTSLIASVLRFAGAAPLTARDEGAADIWSVVTRQTPRDDDGPTLETIETWLEGQDRLVTRAIPGPLDPVALRNASGRDVAAAIVQHAEVTPPTRAIETPERAEPRATATARRRPVRGGARDPRGEHPEPSRRIAADRPAARWWVTPERTVVSRPIGVWRGRHARQVAGREGRCPSTSSAETHPSRSTGSRSMRLA